MVRCVSRAAVGLVLIAGALATGCGGGSAGGVLSPPDTKTMLDVQAQVLGPRCALSGCHTGTTPPKGLDLTDAQTSAANLVGVASVEQPGLMRVQPFDAGSSYLYMKVTGDPSILGDRMPLNRPPLSAADLALLQTWISQGAM